jgi:hypothetical protein
MHHHNKQTKKIHSWKFIQGTKSSKWHYFTRSRTYFLNIARNYIFLVNEKKKLLNIYIFIQF